MMAYIDTKYLGKCETCRNFRNGKCNTYCDHGEEYSPSLSKIPAADVVPRVEFAKEIFEEIGKFVCTNAEDWRVFEELKKKYTEDVNNA